MRRAFAFLLCIIVGVVTMPAQQITYGGTKETDSQTINASGATVTFTDTSGTQTNSFELVVSGGPSTLACTVAGNMPNGTSTTLGTSSGTASQTLNVPGGPYATYPVTCTWTGGSSPSVKVNRIGATARSTFPPASGPWLYSATECPGASLDARVSSCVNRLAGRCGVIDSRGEGNQTLAASMTNWTSCVTWLTPLGTVTEPNGATISVPNTANHVTFWADVMHGSIIDGSNNGNGSEVTMLGNDEFVHGLKIVGGRLNAQTGSNLVFGASGAPTSGDVADHVWLLNSGAVGILALAVDSFSATGNWIEQASTAGIQMQCGNEGVIEDNWVWDAEVNKYVGSGQIDIICPQGVYGQHNITLAHNHVLSGLLGPTVLGTANGGAYGTATVTTGSATVVWATGNQFLSSGLWSNQHMTLNGVDHVLTSCADTTHCTLSAVYADVQNFPTGGCGGGCVVTFTVFITPASISYLLAFGTAANNTGVSVTNGSPNVTLFGATGDSLTVFLAVMASGWFVNIGGTVYTIAGFTSGTAITVSPNYAGSTNTNVTWNAYPTPTQHDTGSSECIQGTATIDGLVLVGNTVENCSSEGYTAGNGSFTAIGNQATNYGFGCNGCAGIIDAVQSGVTQQKNSVHVGPAAITGNVMKATIIQGVPAGGQSGTGNASGHIGPAVWVNVATTAVGSPTISDLAVTGNTATQLFGGFMAQGFKYSNDSTAPATVTLGNFTVSGNAWSPNIATPVSISYTNTLGIIQLGYPDNGGVNAIRVSKSSNQNLTTNTAANLTGLAWTNLAPSGNYSIFCVFYYSAPATGGLEITMSGPASPALVVQGIAAGTSATTPGNQANTAAAFGNLVGAPVVTAATLFPAFYHAAVSLGTAGGTIQMQGASATNAITTTVNAGSTCYLFQS